MSATLHDVVLPPDKYSDVYDGALCEGMYGNVPLELCGSCPVRERCHDLYEDLQFGSLSYGGGVGKLEGVLDGVWGGHLYEKVGPNTRFMRDGKVYPVTDRPLKPAWAP